MGLSPDLLQDLGEMPTQLERVLRLVPTERLAWRPESWGGCPSETFSALEQVCHLRDIERDGYHVRIRRMLTESNPSLDSIDSYAVARERRYDTAHLEETLSAFRQARAVTVESIRGLDDGQLMRTGDFAEYGRLTLRALIHYLRSHDQQHLAGMHWLIGKMSSAWMSRATPSNRGRQPS